MSDTTIVGKMAPTDKQKDRISKITAYLGADFVQNYFYKHFPGGDFSNLTRKQAQKLITGLGIYLPKKPILGVWNSSYWM